MKRKFLSFIFLSVLMFSLGAMVLYADEPSAWAQSYVTRAINTNLVPYNLQSDYTKPITNAEFAALVAAAYESRHGTIVPRLPFINSPNMNVQKAATIGVISGISHNTQTDVTPITREGAALMLSRLTHALGHSLPSASPTFTDNHAISTRTLSAVGQVQAAGIMSGVCYNYFAPEEPQTREQAIITIIRLLDLVPPIAIALPHDDVPMTITDFERRLFELTNAQRQNYQLPPLIWDYTLAYAARLHSRDMAHNNFISHTGSDGSTIGERLSRANLTATGWGENINAGINDATVAIAAWMDSAGNRASILSPHMTHLGVGFYYSSEAEFVFFTTQKFARGLGME